uniref:Uncharacterized protein n=1 Tax=Clytia hemisphaerica TaxID=252671 RepID=A0A7M5V0L3_9CNID
LILDSLLEPTQNLCPSVPVQSISTRSCSTTGQPSTSNPDSQIQSLPTTQKQYIVGGIYALTKDNMKEGMIVPIYAATDHDDNYWLYMLTGLKPRKIEGIFLEKMDEINQYQLGRAQDLVWKNIIHTKKRPVTFYVVEMLHDEGGFYRLPQTAIPMLNSLTT